MSGTLIFTGSDEETLRVAAERKAWGVAQSSEIPAMLDHLADGGTAVVVMERFNTGFRVPEGTTLEFTEACPTDTPERLQAEGRRHTSDQEYGPEMLDVLKSLAAPTRRSGIDITDLSPAQRDMLEGQLKAMAHNPGAYDLLASYDRGDRERDVIPGLYPHQQAVVDALRDDPDAVSRIAGKRRGASTMPALDTDHVRELQNDAARKVLSDRPDIARRLELDPAKDDPDIGRTLQRRSVMLDQKDNDLVTTTLSEATSEAVTGIGKTLDGLMNNAESRMHRHGQPQPRVHYLDIADLDARLAETLEARKARVPDQSHHVKNPFEIDAPSVEDRKSDNDDIDP